jgi:hypothetical protein
MLHGVLSLAMNNADKHSDLPQFFFFTCGLTILMDANEIHD